jgi:hypothetical protein
VTVAYGETIAVKRKTASGKNMVGDPVYVMTVVAVPGCVVWPRASSENAQGQDLIVTGLTLLAPYEADITATDTVTVRGEDYSVVGDPARFASPFTNLQAGVEIQLLKVTG